MTTQRLATVVVTGVFALAATAHAGTTTATNTSLTPYGLATDAAGNVYIADAANAVVRRIDPTGNTVTTVAGVAGSTGLPTPGPATGSKLSVPAALAIVGSDLYIADSGGNEVVEKVSGGTLSIVAGMPGQFSGSVTPGPATSSQLYGPSGLALDGTGNLFISDSLNAVVERVDASTQNLSIVAGIPGVFSSPVTVGPATSSYLYMPLDVAVGSGGDLYIADSGNHLVERVDGMTHDISIFAGDKGKTGAPVAGPADQSPLSGPAGLAVDGAGNVYIADALNNMVLKVDLNGDLSVVAGTGIKGAPTPGKATDATLNGPTDLATDATGNLYIADTGNHLVLKVDTLGTLSIFAGTGQGLDLAPPVKSITCTSGSLMGTYYDVTVPAGGSCSLNGAHVLHDLIVTDAAWLSVTDTIVDHDMTITGTDGLTVTDSTIGHDATLADNEGPLTFLNNKVGGKLKLSDNKGFPDSSLVVGNSVGRSVTCSGNAGLAETCNAGGVSNTLPPEPVTDTSSGGGARPSAGAAGTGSPSGGTGNSQKPDPGVPSHDFRLVRVTSDDAGNLSVDLRLPGPGSIDVLATAGRSRLTARAATFGPGKRRFAYARAAARATKAGPFTVALKRTRSGRKAMALARRSARPLFVNVWVTYLPDGKGGTAKVRSRLHIPLL